MGIRKEPLCLDMAMISDKAIGNLFTTGYFFLGGGSLSYNIYNLKATITGIRLS